MAGSRINRGEVWLVDLGMAAKARPVVILSVEYLDEERALVSYVPRITSVRGTRFEVMHEARGFMEGAFDAQSIGTLPAVKFLRRISTLDSSTLAKVEEAIRLWLAL